MDQLIKTLPAILAVAEAPAELFETACIFGWNHIVGPILQEHTKPWQLVDEKLTVSVPDTVWQKQLESMRGELRFRLNSILGQRIVAFIEFKVDPTRFRQSPVAASRSTLTELPVPQELQSAGASIKDNDLRNSFFKAAVSSLRRLENSQHKRQ